MNRKAYDMGSVQSYCGQHIFGRKETGNGARKVSGTQGTICHKHDSKYLFCHMD